MLNRNGIILGLLTLLFLATRLVNLTLLPVFNDETLYISMARKLLSDPIENFYIGFQDGKEPLFFWLLAIFLKIFPDPVMAARILSSLAGLIGLGFFYYLSRKLFSGLTAIVLSLAYIFSPFLLLYQRLGILDSLLVSSLTAVLYLLHATLTKNSVKNSVLLGIAIGISLLTKTSSSLFLLGMFPLVVYLCPKVMHPKKIILLLTTSTVVALLIYSSILFHPLFPAIAEKNQTFIYSPSEMVSGGLGPFITNLKQSFRWLLGYEGWPIFLISLCGVGVLILRRKYQVLPWLIMLAFPIVTESAIAKIFFPRYLLFILIPLYILLGFILDEFLTVRNRFKTRHSGLSRVSNRLEILDAPFGLTRMTKMIGIEIGSKNKRLKYIVATLLLIIFLLNITLSSQIIFQPERANLPSIEQWQYVDGWPSGYGVKETAKFLSGIKAQKVISESIVAVSIGVPNYMTFPQTIFETGKFDPLNPQLPEKYLTESYNGALFVFTQIQSIPSSWPLQLEKTFPRGDNGEKISIYRRL